MKRAYFMVSGELVDRLVLQPPLTLADAQRIADYCKAHGNGVQPGPFALLTNGEAEPYFLPDDAKAIRVFYEYASDRFGIAITSETLGDVAEGAMGPRLPIDTICTWDVVDWTVVDWTVVA